MIPDGHGYRKFLTLIDFDSIDARLAKLRKENLNEGYGLPALFKCLFLQHLEDLSDLELESERKCGCRVVLRVLADGANTGSYGFYQSTFPHRYAGTFGNFCRYEESAKSKGLCGEIFTFTDSTHIITKCQFWKNRDTLIEGKYEKMNNENISKVAENKKAKFGYKGNGKF
jgi:hypothetical protein